MEYGKLCVYTHSEVGLQHVLLAGLAKLLL